MPKFYAGLLHANAPQSLLVWIEEYLHGAGDVRFFLAASVQHGTAFVEFGLVKHTTDTPWLVAIAPQYIVGIVEVGETGEHIPIGFHTK